ncbi:MAG: peptidylprolyl isomerase [Marinosulfonomonas sp.]|nr:peptidylprolyl isomerase [Marinosulfonomonas sp.]
MTIIRFLALCLTFVALAIPAGAQNMFAPAVKVNEQVVTNYEVDQRAKFLTLLRAPGDPREAALKALIDERLQTEAARVAGVILTDEQVEVGMEEFAARANLSTEDFIKALAGGGVAAETFRDFVKSGLAWRELVRARFGPRSQITEAEVDRAISQTSGEGGLRVLLSEIILPATPEMAAQSQRRAEQIAKLTTTGAFSAQARQHSASGSRERGGRLDWMPLSNLPAQIRGQILALSPGQVTPPISITNGIVLFQLRAIEETEVKARTDIALEYAVYYIAGGRSDAALKEAARIKARVDTCDDLYAINKGQPEERLVIDTLPIADVPQDVAIELAKLDPGEVSINLTRSNGETLMFLMLCGRTPELGEDVSREQVRARLTNQRLQSYADGYLSDLKADATIVYP